MPIVIAPVGKPLKVVRIAADEKTKKHLESLGITVTEKSPYSVRAAAAWFAR